MGAGQECPAPIRRVEDADVHGSGMQVDAAVATVLSIVEFHHSLPVKRVTAVVVWQLPAYLMNRGHDEYPDAAPDRGGT
jgi:hypothetical protein